MVLSMCSTVGINEIFGNQIESLQDTKISSFDEIFAKQTAKAESESKPWTYIPSNVSEHLDGEGFQVACCDEKIGSFDEYVAYRQEQTHMYVESDETYKAGYAKYMKERECNNEDELAILNSTPFFTKSQMTGTVAHILSFTQNLAGKYGINLDSDKLMSLFSSTDMQNMADFANDFLSVNTAWQETASSLERGISCLKDFISDVYQQAGLSEDIKSDLNDLFNSISPDETLLGYIEKQEQAQKTEATLVTCI
jgi:hypothetical protein